MLPNPFKKNPIHRQGFRIFSKLNKPKVRNRVMQQFVGIGKSVVENVSELPRDLAKSAASSVTGKKFGSSENRAKRPSISADEHSKNVTNYLYEGKSLTPEQRAAREKQEKLNVPNELEQQRRVLRSHIKKHELFQPKSRQEMSLQEEYEREEQQKQMVEMEKRKNELKDIALPSSAKRGPGAKKLKHRQKSKESKLAFKGAG